MVRTAVAVLLVSIPLLWQGTAFAGSAAFEFADWGGPAIPVRWYVPEQAAADAPIVIVMHGNSRDAPRYFDDWQKQGEMHGFIVVVPEFTADRFPGSARYNLGWVFDPVTGEMQPESAWTFSAIEALFDQVVARTGNRSAGYTLYGHSAGAQFVHRFLYYKPDARVTRAIVANAGWYTMPDFGVRYPYGLGEAGVPGTALAATLERDVVVLLGDADTERADDSLRKTPEAELQGPHRYARGQTFFRVARARADRLGVLFNWRIEIVPGATHSNAEMTPRAAHLVVR